MSGGSERLVIWLRALACALLLMLGACGPGQARDQQSGPLWADPGLVRMSPDHTHAVIEIHNRSGTIRPVSAFRLDGPDWGSLRFVDESLPRTVPGRDSVRVELSLSSASLQVEPGRYRDGAATLHFSSDQFEYAVPIEFVGSDAAPRWGSLVWTTLALLGLVAVVAWPVRARLGDRGERGSAVAGTWLVIAAAFASLLLAASLIPIGFGACAGRLGTWVGPRELAQCRAGLGGAPMIGLELAPGLWWWMVALGIAAVATSAVRWMTAPDDRAAADVVPTAALAGLRVLGFSLILAALLCGLAPLDTSPSELARVQAESFEVFGIPLPRWGLIAQPLGAVLALVLLVQPRSREHEHAVVVILERLSVVCFAGIWVTAFGGGAGLPFLSSSVPILPHAGMLGLELLVFVGKLVGVLLGIAWVQRRANAWTLVQAHARWTVPLAVGQLVLLLLWQLS